jgi:hypothetical protein
MSARSQGVRDGQQVAVRRKPPRFLNLDFRAWQTVSSDCRHGLALTRHPSIDRGSGHLPEFWAGHLPLGGCWATRSRSC